MDSSGIDLERAGRRLGTDLRVRSELSSAAQFALLHCP
jgi:hypothetical protein